MKIVIDDKIPYIKGVFEAFAEVVYLPGHLTTAEVVRGADAIITRTRTECNEALLSGSKVRFIATATIGYDHIDTKYCNSVGINWTNAAGCNAKSVEQYIASTLFTWALDNRIKLREKTIGIVGVGNVGSKVSRLCNILGMRVLLNDPPRQEMEGPEQFVSLKTIKKEADIITFHVPLDMEGKYATYHMGNSAFFNDMQNKPLLINASRGEVWQTEAVKSALKNGLVSDVVIDCWENEPDIDRDLLEMAFLATPHIAGYSKDGKANGTMMSVQSVSRFFNLGLDDWQPTDIELPENTDIKLDGSRRDEESIIAEAVLSSYDISDDDEKLRNHPEKFEKLRGDYPVRREFPVYTVFAGNVEPYVISKLTEIGFRIK